MPKARRCTVLSIMMLQWTTTAEVSPDTLAQPSVISGYPHTGPRRGGLGIRAPVFFYHPREFLPRESRAIIYIKPTRRRQSEQTSSLFSGIIMIY